MAITKVAKTQNQLTIVRLFLTAELLKYLNNVFLTTKISFIEIHEKSQTQTYDIR